MRNALSILSRFKSDEDGAALIEYTVLLAILLIAVITTIGLVGTWIAGRWTALNAALPAAGGGGA
jgi:pilus assembly protein Flp/PilA